LVKDENVDPHADSHNSLNSWKNNYCYLLIVHGINDDKQIEIPASKPLVPKHSSIEDEIANEKL
jgi:hypothetical protein